MPIKIEMMAKDTICLVDALDIKRAHIVGCSLGRCIVSIAESYLSDQGTYSYCELQKRPVYANENH